jgi:hypothetical protein
MEGFGMTALYAVIGGLAGAALGALVARLVKTRPAGRFIGVAAIAGLAILGALIANPLFQLSPNFEAGEAASPSPVDGVLAELKEDRILAAILDREPELERAFRTELAAIIDSGGEPAAAAERGFAFAHETVTSRLNQYLLRARDEDLVAYFDSMTAILVHLTTSHPRFCHAYLFEPERLLRYTPEDIKTRLTLPFYDRLQAAGAAAVSNAGEEIPEYDAHTAELMIAMGGMLMHQTLGDDRISLVTVGERPRTVDDARAACDAMVKVNMHYLMSDRPAPILRHLIALSQGK